MSNKQPTQVIKYKYVTEKTTVLQNLQKADSNKSVRKCQSPKYSFVVDKDANKQEIAKAVEEIYKDDQIKVVSVNTINVKPKQRRVRGRLGEKSAFKKAIVTLQPGDKIGNEI